MIENTLKVSVALRDALRQYMKQGREQTARMAAVRRVAALVDANGSPIADDTIRVGQTVHVRIPQRYR